MKGLGNTQKKEAILPKFHYESVRRPPTPALLPGIVFSGILVFCSLPTTLLAALAPV